MRKRINKTFKKGLACFLVICILGTNIVGAADVTHKKPSKIQLVAGLILIAAGSFMSAYGLSTETEVKYYQTSTRVDVSRPSLASDITFSNENPDPGTAYRGDVHINIIVSNTGNVDIGSFDARINLRQYFDRRLNKTYPYESTIIKPGESITYSDILWMETFAKSASITTTINGYTPVEETRYATNKIETKKERDKTLGYAGFGVIGLGSVFLTNYLMMHHKWKSVSILPQNNSAGYALAYKF